ncbi:redox-regulated ATPase YchF [Candidatus Micrarchaeota archaeon]|nr:redox-regulated ATPase YchF [Candidatus Micrarchaeota archaeon]
MPQQNLSMALSIGVVGKPNAGKSTFFSALTMAEAKIASFPFTTLDPNIGVGYVRKQCPHNEKGKACNPRDSYCRNGIRFVPVRMLDVAGLVPDAHKGKGLGFKFLDDLASADALIHVVDASGKTDLQGNPTENHNPIEEVKFLQKELLHWVLSIMERNWKKVRTRNINTLSSMLSGLKIPPSKIEDAARRLSLETERIDWSTEEKLAFSGEILKAKPILVVLNKFDQAQNREGLLKEFSALEAVPASSLFELTLKKADFSGAIEYIPGSSSFKTKDVSKQQGKALEKISAYLEKQGNTGVQQALERLIYDRISRIVAFPVEDENEWADQKGNILPNAFLMPRGSTPLDLAERIHTDIAGNFVAALDARKKTRLAKDYQLKDCDIIKVFSK